MTGYRKRGVSALIAVVMALSLLAGCSGGAKDSGGSAGGDVTIPAGYPDDYKQIVEASKKENSLLIYSNMAEYNWRPVIEGFNKLYPWIEVQTLDLGSGEVFERFYSEKASGAGTGDMLVSASPDNWIDLVQNRKEVLDYESPEAKNVPEWSRPLPGLYTVSADPMVILYNKHLLPENLRPTSMKHLAELAKANPDVFDGQITTYDAARSFGYNINFAFNRENDSYWNIMKDLGPMVRPEASSGPMIEKVTSGEYKVAYFVSGIVLFPKMKDLGEILGWSHIKDGAPLFLRGVAIPKNSKHVNSAKLMLDYIISHEGQVAFGQGGLTPYRPDVKQEEVPRRYQSILDDVGGEDNVIFINYDPNVISGRDAFINQWKQAFGR